MSTLLTTPPDFVLNATLMDQARMQSVAADTSLVSALQELSGWDNNALMKVLGQQFGYRSLGMAELQSLSPDFDILAYTECVQRGLIWLVDGASRATLVLSDPFDEVSESWALRKGTRLYSQVVDVALAHPDDVQVYLAQQERQVRAMDGFEVESRTASDEEVAAVITLATINDDTSSVVKLVNSTLYDALKLQASDIHLECDSGSLYVSYRIDGVLVPITEVQGQEMAEQVISRVKVMAELDIAERRIPQDGRFKVRVNGREIDFRVSVMPNIFGEDAVLRLLDRQSLTEEARALRLENLGLDELAIASIRQLAHKPHGMLLVTGPTGSGKTTTLYAAITEIHTGRDKIITIEDPVEYRLPRVLQIPVNEKKGLTFARGLRSILRHDPDKIMVGEIRDDETAQIAVQAALTGHLVFTTVHANNVFDVLGRFLHMGVDAYSFAAALNGIVAQRLLRMNCPLCSVRVDPGAELLLRAGLCPEDVQGWKFRAGQGCGHCRGVGYKGRKAIAEVLLLNDVLRELIAQRAPISLLKEQAGRTGLRDLRQSAMECVTRGDTTLEEVMRVAG
ncbi:GspE/PulE family protein [Iodobacter ciconiae]|uniref:Type II/IV secretion system protein n=1 Tax=Iodobacter ciconiae TaxID=2496266 RepID=A0A3S8ZPR2_9NEIS|nr:GspE/PulE family protein [Iodobacter ciconiae]AZN35471.1 type II/IV secretion system protein [Iodobacter ciconiae]